MSAGAVSVLQMKLPTQLPLQALLFICLLMHRAILGISITYLRNDSQRLNKKKKFPLPAFYITFNIFYTKGQYQLRLNLDRCQFKSLSYLFVCWLQVCAGRVRSLAPAPWFWTTSAMSATNSFSLWASRLSCGFLCWRWNTSMVPNYIHISVGIFHHGLQAKLPRTANFPKNSVDPQKTAY